MGEEFRLSYEFDIALSPKLDVSEHALVLRDDRFAIPQDEG
ncbi:MAG: hypothetical protein Q8R82_12640 [Hyphomonadaceae bacterium]|nr:hypothetical protein [Hyphomonadaceae bacterium]